nr:hypothetical protein [Tanacetum cinerariifolium]
MINAQVDDLSSHNTKYTFPALTQKVCANIRRIGKGFSGVETPLFDAMLVQEQVQDADDVEEDEDDNKVATLEQDKIAQVLEIVKLKQRVRKVEKRRRPKHLGLKRLRKGRMAESQAKVYKLDLHHSEKVLSMQDTDKAEPAKVEEVLEVVTAAKLMTEVVTTVAPITTTAQVPKTSASRRRRGVVIQDPRETAATSVTVHTELEAELNANINWDDVMKQVKRREKQDNTVMRYQALKRKPVTEAQARKNMMIYLKNMAGFKMDFLKEKGEKEIEEEGSKRKGKNLENLKQDTAKRQRIEEEAEELKRHLQIVVNNDDDVFTEATPLASKPKHFSDDFLLSTLKILFEKPNVEANIWRDQKSRYGLAKVKSWKLFESCGVHILTLTTTQMIVLVEKKYPLTRFTLEQMLNNVRLEVKEESEMSLELLRLIRRQLTEGLKKAQEKDKIGSKPDKNGKRGKAGKS